MKRSSRARALSLGIAGFAALAMALTAWGQGLGGRPVLHLDVPPPPMDEDEDTDADGPVLFGAGPGDGSIPAAFSYRTKILPAPEIGTKSADTEPVYGRNGFAVDRFTETRPDTETGADDTLQYVGVFNPSVLPFKRMSAMNSVRADYTLYIDDSGTLQDLSVGGVVDTRRDLFWGDLMVELEPGVDVPIPSVAPDMRILSYETAPRLAVTFSKDSSDNYFVRSDENSARGVYHLRFMVDASFRYFAPEVPAHLQVSDIAAQAPPGLIKQLPPDIQAAANQALGRLSLSRSTRLLKALDTLTEHFRAFTAKPMPRRTGDVYLDLFESQAGVCRHRAFGFMITALGLGIPTRYVTNEAHAWVESWIPEIGWVRIDLGGAALRMQVDNASNKSLYHPRGEDPFAKPFGYANSYTQLDGDISGLSQEQITERRQHMAATQANASTASDSDAPRRNPFNPGAPTREAGPSIPSADFSMPVIIAPGSNLPELRNDLLAGKRRTRIQITHVDAEGFRGEPLHVSGDLLSGDRGIAGLPVTILLAPAGQGGNDAVVVGNTVTRSDGSFDAEVELPTELQLQDYEVYVSTPGDASYAPTLSR
jgi:transglutaminase-like putative cysteine protease